MHAAQTGKRIEMKVKKKKGDNLRENKKIQAKTKKVKVLA